MEIVLTPISPGRDAEFDAMLEEYRAAGEAHVYNHDLAVAWQSYSAFCEAVSRMQVGGYPRADVVPTDMYFIERDGRMCGQVSVRRRLPPGMEFRGHIGYMVRPSERNRGVATAALRLTLHKIAAIGIDPALLTCREANAASARVIEKCGGVRIEDSVTEFGIHRRYWVPTARR